jgi:polysaccharide biosynthesis protein VpsM
MEMTMQSRYLCLLLGLINTAVFAQTTDGAAAGTAPAQESSSGSEVSAPDNPLSASENRIGPAVSAPSYGLSGGGFRTTRRSDDYILTAPPPERGAPIKTDSGIVFYPSVFVAAGHNDNLLGSSDNTLESSFLNTSPAVIAEMRRRGDRYTLAASLNDMAYRDSSADNFLNHDVRFAGDNYFSARSRMGWSLGHIGSIDPRGTTQRDVSDRPDRWHAGILEGRYLYGAPSAQGRVEVDASYVSKRYDNNREITETGDVDRAEIAGRFYYRVGTRTMTFVEARFADFDYALASSLDDNTEQRYYLGFAWEATAATVGSIKVGHMNKDFKAAGREDFSGGSWEAAVRWLPLTYSAIDASTSRWTSDATGVGEYLVNTSGAIAWSHKWSGYLVSRLSYDSTRSRFAATDRVDTLNTVHATIDYALLRWVTVGIDYAHMDRDSNAEGAPYNRNVVMFTANFTL